ncbi:MAG: flavin reductase family protein [Flavobacteriaceae bacterium]|nr:flavin reductase family protein [Flavobacteriaceae bacterium]
MKQPPYTVKSIIPSEIPVAEMHNYLRASVAPRPIALVSSVSADGEIALSSFSFFNVFSANPPVLIFSPTRRVRDNSTKHTLENVKKTRECVINVVTEDIVQQASLSSTEFEKGINEFEKAGFHEVKSDLVAPPRVLESKVSFECKVKEILELGTDAGAGSLVVCEVVKMHIHGEVLGDDGRICTERMKLVARMGENWYSKAFGDALFEISKPLHTLGAGFDKLPREIRESEILTGNDLAKLANIEAIPPGVYSRDVHDHARAKQLLNNCRIHDAWQALIR